MRIGASIELEAVANTEWPGAAAVNPNSSVNGDDRNPPTALAESCGPICESSEQPPRVLGADAIKPFNIANGTRWYTRGSKRN